MNLSDIPNADREGVYFGLLKWMISNDRYSWLNTTKHSKVNSVSVSAPAPIKGGTTTISVNIASHSAGFDAKVIVFAGEEAGVAGNVTYIAQLLFPKLNGPSEGAYYEAAVYGVAQTVNITSTAQTVNIQMPVKHTVKNFPSLSFYVLVCENLNLHYFDSGLIPLADAQGSFSFGYDAPVLTNFVLDEILFGFCYRDRVGIEENPKGIMPPEQWADIQSDWRQGAYVTISFTVKNYVFPSDTIVGLVFSTSQNPTFNPENIQSPANMVVFAQLTLMNAVTKSFQAVSIGKALNLLSNTTYFVRPFAFNGKTTYADQFQLTTPTFGDGEIL